MTRVPPAAGDFGWFTTWVDQRLGVCLTLARGLSADELLEGFAGHAGTRAAGAETFDEADAGVERNRHRVRVGERGGWAYAVEHFTSRGAHPDTLGRLAASGGEALALTYTQTISAFDYAADGAHVCGFDLVVPRIRWGTEPDRFAAAMALTGFLRPAPREREPALGARFVQLAFGVTVDREMLEQPLPSFELLPHPSTI